MLRRPPISASRERMLASPTPACPLPAREFAEMPIPSSAMTRWIAERRKQQQNADVCCPRVTMDVGQGFLGNAVDGAFRRRRNRVGFPEEVERCLEVRSPVEAFNKQVCCADKAQLLQRRRVGKVGNRTDFLLRFRHQVLDLFDDSNRFLIRRLSLEIAQEQPDRDQQLRRRIVQLTREPLTFDRLPVDEGLGIFDLSVVEVRGFRSTPIG